MRIQKFPRTQIVVDGRPQPRLVVFSSTVSGAGRTPNKSAPSRVGAQVRADRPGVGHPERFPQQRNPMVPRQRISTTAVAR